MSQTEPLQTDNSSTDTNAQTNLETWGTGTTADYEPAPTYEDPHTTTNIHNVSLNNPLGRMHSSDVGDLERATHLAYGKYHDDVTTDVTHEHTVYDPDTAQITTEIVTEEVAARSLYYHSELVTPDRAIDALEEMPPTYNSFTRNSIIELINALPADAKIGVARESSPALYIWHNDTATLADTIDEHLTTSEHPDEIGIVDTGDTHTFPNANVGSDLRQERTGTWNLVRMWWD